MNKICTAFTENERELWYFTPHRPTKQSLLHYVFRCISKIKQIRLGE